MLARPVNALPEGEQWRYEPKWDGVRALAATTPPRITSRSGTRVDAKFPEITTELTAQLSNDTLVDGEIVRWSGDRLDFAAVLRRMRMGSYRARRLAAEEPCHLIVFDLLRWEGVDLTGHRLAYRRQYLQSVFAEVVQPSVLMLGWQTSDLDEAREWFEVLPAVEAEGLVIKDAHQPYRPGRRDWLKLKRRVTTEAIVGGVIGRADRPLSLVLGRYDPSTGALRVTGHSTELSRAQQDELGPLLRKAGGDHPWPRTLAPHSGGNERVHYTRVDPAVVVEVEPDTAVAAGRWRHVVRYVRARDDVGPWQVPPPPGPGDPTGAAAFDRE